MSKEESETNRYNPEADPRRPDVELVGHDGNAFEIVGSVGAALKRAGYTKEEVSEYRKQATSGDYTNLMIVSMQWADVT